MIYNIAGLLVEIYGDCRLNQTTVHFAKDKDNFVYRRTNEKAFELKNNGSSGENFSPDGLRFSNDEEIKLENDFLSAVIKGDEPFENTHLSRYSVRRMAAYELKVGAAENLPVPDFRIIYKLSPFISYPEGERLGLWHGFEFYRRKDGGLSWIKKIPELSEVLARADYGSDLKSADIEVFDVSGLGGMETGVRIHSYVGEAFAHLALLNKKVVFHSSAISYKENGICFSAPSGTGKSTHTSLWLKNYPEDAEIINDDTPLLYIENGKTVLSGTPWSGKTELNINKAVPLKGIVVLTRSKDNFIRRLKGMEAVKGFFEQLKIPPFAEFTSLGGNLAMEILETVPVYLLGCNISDEAVETVKEGLGI